ncbi:UNVERIFIED_CONTAM: hypothetical protein Sradi_5988500 [Sesamum radiatum]|uniref:Uncharacterized protein n=1 Tax=Sesamum radiatum TaxID=300843 RepID=A0AAW2KGZ0_SESRA
MPGNSCVCACILKRTKSERETESCLDPCSLRAENRIVPVSSPTRHSAILVFWFCGPRKVGLRGFLLRTVLEFTTFTMRVWPFVPGFKASTLTKTGLRSPGLFPAAAPCCRCVVGDLVHRPR